MTVSIGCAEPNAAHRLSSRHHCTRGGRAPPRVRPRISDERFETWSAEGIGLRRSPSWLQYMWILDLHGATCVATVATAGSRARGQQGGTKISESLGSVISAGVVPFLL